VRFALNHFEPIIYRFFNNFETSTMKGRLNLEQQKQFDCVLKRASDLSGYEPETITSKCRKRELVATRLSIIMALGFHKWSVVDIAGAFNVDHSTICHAKKQFEATKQMAGVGDPLAKATVAIYNSLSNNKDFAIEMQSAGSSLYAIVGCIS